MSRCGPPCWRSPALSEESIAKGFVFFGTGCLHQPSAAWGRGSSMSHRFLWFAVDARRDLDVNSGNWLPKSM